jgi:predicted protein tyrosine phosphatase
MIEANICTEGLRQASPAFSGIAIEHSPRATSLRRVTPNHRPAWVYGLSAVACLLVAVALPPWGMFFVWPAFGFGLLSLAYLEAGPAIFRKKAGRLPIGTRLLFGPYLTGNAIAFRFCRRRSPGYIFLTDGIYLGRMLSNSEADEFIEQGLTAVLDLTAEYAECNRFRELAYKNVAILDLTLPTADQLGEAVDFIRHHVVHGRVYIHCALGYFRGPCIAAAYLLATGEADCAEEAVAMVCRARPQTVVPKGLVELLRQCYGERPRLANAY